MESSHEMMVEAAVDTQLETIGRVGIPGVRETATLEAAAMAITTIVEASAVMDIEAVDKL